MESSEYSVSSLVKRIREENGQNNSDPTKQEAKKPLPNYARPINELTSKKAAQRRYLRNQLHEELKHKISYFY